MNYYLIFVYNDIDPDLTGPFPSEELRDDYARELRGGYGKNHGYYPLDINGPGKPKISTYSGGFFMEQEED